MQRRTMQNSSKPAQAAGVAPSVHETLRSSGTPLDAATRRDLEPRFGHDFSHVRIHTDAKAAASARDVDALAYTVGRNVVFGAGQFSPGTYVGRKLLAHELAHVVQQGSGSVESSAPLKMGEPDSAFEREAESAAVHLDHRTNVFPNQPFPTRLLQRTAGDATDTKSGKENDCAGWFADHESLSKRAAELYVRTELSGKRGTVVKIDCDMVEANGAFACTVRFSDGTEIRVIARTDSIVVGVAPLKSMKPPADRPLCYYAFTCPGPNHDLVLTKTKCNVATAPSVPAANPAQDRNV